MKAEAAGRNGGRDEYSMLSAAQLCERRGGILCFEPHLRLRVWLWAPQLAVEPVGVLYGCANPGHTGVLPHSSGWHNHLYVWILAAVEFTPVLPSQRCENQCPQEGSAPGVWWRKSENIFHCVRTNVGEPWVVNSSHTEADGKGQVVGGFFV